MSKKQTIQAGKLNSRKIITIILAISAIIVLFAFFDYLIHSLSEEYAVPSYYYKNKIIFGGIIGIAAYFILRKMRLTAKTILFSSIIAILLQARYFIEGYPLEFVLEFLVIHFLILAPLSYIIFKLMKL